MITENKKVTYDFGKVSFGPRDDYYHFRLHVEARPTYMTDPLSGSSHAPEIIRPNVIFLRIEVRLWEGETGRDFLVMRTEDISAKMAHMVADSRVFAICDQLARTYLDGRCTNREVRLSEGTTDTLEGILNREYLK